MLEQSISYIYRLVTYRWTTLERYKGRECLIGNNTPKDISVDDICGLSFLWKWTNTEIDTQLVVVTYTTDPKSQRFFFFF